VDRAVFFRWKDCDERTRKWLGWRNKVQLRAHTLDELRAIAAGSGECRCKPGAAAAELERRRARIRDAVARVERPRLPRTRRPAGADR
jgi:hypothetical protein